MKILELHIQEVRGVGNLHLKLDGANVVVQGPNGSGKSAIVDGLEFLLTGRISRLTGRGMSGITLAKHGPHVGARAARAVVTAVVQLPDRDGPLTLSRCIANPGQPSCDVPGVAIDAVLDYVRQHTHVLTRRDILKYIAAEPSSRAQEVQELLRLTELEDMRKSLVKARNELENSDTRAKAACESAKKRVCATAGLERYDPALLLNAVNRWRGVLGAEPAATVTSECLKVGVAPPSHATPPLSGPGCAVPRADLAVLQGVTSPTESAKMAEADTELRQLLLEVRSEAGAAETIRQLYLVQAGLALLGASGHCPLCDTPWPADALRAHLEAKAARGTTNSKRRERITALSAGMHAPASLIAEGVRRVLEADGGRLEEASRATLTRWHSDLLDFAAVVSLALENYPDERFPSSMVQVLLAPPAVTTIICEIERVLCGDQPGSSPQQSAWDALTGLKANLEVLEAAERDTARAATAFSRGRILVDEFLAARDNVLEELYRTVQTRFAEFYRRLHGVDEEDFAASLAPDGAGVDMRVAFYDKGLYPPQAYHSEGHQDSMGLCLYLALAEVAAGASPGLMVLDDVVMSIDSGHRRRICALLEELQGQWQFLITTHDTAWAHQLRSTGVVQHGGAVELSQWHVDTGPVASSQGDLWPAIRERLSAGDVHRAAPLLRRGAEQYFAQVCESLGAQVTYKSDRGWDLGELVSAAVGQYRHLLKLAKVSAESWSKAGDLEDLIELDTTVGQISGRCQAENWAVNSAVHYNQWENFSKGDFEPVCDAFEDLFGLFRCPQCQATLYVTPDSRRPQALRCRCGRIAWNLMKRRN